MKYLPLPGIYKITNLINGKGYVGKSYNIFNRWICHYRSAKKLHDGKKPLKGTGAIHRAMNKYDIENFKFDMLFIFPLGIEITDSMLSTFEIFFIADQDTYIDNGKGYNLTKGGEGIKPSQQTLKRMSEKSLGSKNGFFGKHHTSEAIAKNREAHQGLCNLTKEQLEQYSIKHSGEGNPFYGKGHSEDYFRKRSKPILCIETGKFYRSCGFAAVDTNQLPASIYKAAKLGTYAGGLRWKFITWEEYDKLAIQFPLWETSLQYMNIRNIKKRLSRENRRLYVHKIHPVQCIETGKVFKSTGEVGKLFNIRCSNITNAIRKGQRSCGFYWRYITWEEYDVLNGKA
jgi:group I intron endonuclease